MSKTFKVCTASTALEIEALVQACLDMNYTYASGICVTSTIDSSNVITYLYVQTMKVNNS